MLRLLLLPCCIDMCDPEMLIKEGVGIVCSIRKLHPRKGEADGRERERDIGEGEMC